MKQDLSWLDRRVLTVAGCSLLALVGVTLSTRVPFARARTDLQETREELEASEEQLERAIQLAKSVAREGREVDKISTLVQAAFPPWTESSRLSVALGELAAAVGVELVDIQTRDAEHAPGRVLQSARARYRGSAEKVLLFLQEISRTSPVLHASSVELVFDERRQVDLRVEIEARFRIAERAVQSSVAD